MNNIEEEYNKIVSENSWVSVFQELNNQCRGYNFTCYEGKKVQNHNRNRYRDVYPYDHTRIILQRIPNGYINANLVEVPQVNTKYILTQGPLPSTVSHFWLMVWEQNSRGILMLNEIIENGRVKCHFYWPSDIGHEHKLHFNDVQLTIEKISEEELHCHRIRIFRIHDLTSNTSREVIQFHYKAWSDFSVPQCPAKFLKFWYLIRKSGIIRTDSTDIGPLIVHCSAGVGRSGTFCLIDTCLAMAEQDGPNNIDIQKVLLHMRCDRKGLVQTWEQLRFSYKAVILGYKCLDENKILSPSTLEANRENNEPDEEVKPTPPPRSGSLFVSPLRKRLPSIPVVQYTGSEVPPSSNSSSCTEEETASTGTDAETPDICVELFPPSQPSTVSRRHHRTEESSSDLDMFDNPTYDIENWNPTEKSAYNPVPIGIGLGIGCLLAGALIYAFVRRSNI